MSGVVPKDGRSGFASCERPPAVSGCSSQAPGTRRRQQCRIYKSLLQTKMYTTPRRFGSLKDTYAAPSREGHVSHGPCVIRDAFCARSPADRHLHSPWGPRCNGAPCHKGERSAEASQSCCSLTLASVHLTCGSLLFRSLFRSRISKAVLSLFSFAKCTPHPSCSPPPLHSRLPRSPSARKATAPRLTATAPDTPDLRATVASVGARIILVTVARYVPLHFDILPPQ